MKKNYIMAPGPTEVPPVVLAAAALPIIHHRTSEYRQVLKEVSENLKYVFQTKNEVIIFPAAGTGAMEAAVVNLVSPGDKVLVASIGNFGDRWADIAKTYGAVVNLLAFEWGSSADPKKIDQELKKDPSIKAVFTTHSETSTGAANDIKAIGAVIKNYPAVLVVDAVSSLGALEFKMDEWSVDAVAVGSQKGLMIPPGLGFLCMSEKARGLAKNSKTPKYYFSYEKALKKATEDKLPDTPYTSSVSLVMQLKEALRIIKAEGIENVWARHIRLAEAVRTAVKAMGLEIFATGIPNNAVTAVKMPGSLDSAELVKLIRQTYGIFLVGGQGKVKGKIFRIGHLGYAADTDVILAIAAVEMALTKMGHHVELGKGVKAAQEYLMAKE